MSSSFSFECKIDPAAAATLKSGGYKLCVSKSTAGGSPVQWLSIDLVAPTVDVSWLEQYSVYFSTTSLQNGATIVQGQQQPANIGRQYTYSTDTFTFSDTGAAPNVSSIQIINGLTSMYTYGLSQQASVVGAKPVLSPIAAVAITPNNGQATFTPSETVTVYFSNQFTSNGCFVNASGVPYTFTLKAGVNTTIAYAANGSWSTQSSLLNKVAVPKPALAYTGGILGRYLVRTSAAVAATAIALAAKTYLENQKVAVITVQKETPAQGVTSIATMTFQGNVDVSTMNKVVEGMAGTKVQDSFLMPIVGGFQYAGTEAYITDVTPDDSSSLELVMFNNEVANLASKANKSKK